MSTKVDRGQKDQAYPKILSLGRGLVRDVRIPETFEERSLTHPSHVCPPCSPTTCRHPGPLPGGWEFLRAGCRGMAAMVPASSGQPSCIIKSPKCRVLRPWSARSRPSLPGRDPGVGGTGCRPWSCGLGILFCIFCVAEMFPVRIYPLCGLKDHLEN